MLKEKGPLLIAANHPNSFLDAIILSSLFKNPVHSLARGDAFANKFYTKLLTSLNMLPVYRLREGAENIGHNYTTFSACKKLFENDKIVLIFSEGLCINEWHLRNLKKGTARLALDSWESGIPLKVLPLGFNYSSFRKFGKIVHLNFGTFIEKKNLGNEIVGGKAINKFNELLQAQLSHLVYEIKTDDKVLMKKTFHESQSMFSRAILFIPAVVGFFLNAPLYYAAHHIIKNQAEDHYDSVMTGILFLFYPIYMLLFSLILFLITASSFSFLLFLLMPLTALCLLHFRKAID